MASPASLAATSEVDPPSSPGQPEAKSFVSRAMTEDDDTQMANATPDPQEKSSRGKTKSSQNKDAANQPTIGKIRHLKKEDGEPLWREDIQYDFLKAVFDNEQCVFTNSYEPKRLQRQCFADLYIDTMSRSSKTSKVLRDKLLSDREAAKGMAMVCLLVNMGRMNTTLNFFPEMRAQLRTYHAIPSLQARQDPHAYKQLQDAPRLKSILKGGAEDREEPNSLDKIKQLDTPRTNPVNLIFVMCNTAQKIAELHFPRHRELHDLIMRTEYTSKSRANAFLWLMWFYLESDFTEEGCEENPFGPGVDYGLDVANQGVPELVEMTPEEKAKENVDTEEEIEFGRSKQKMRAKILEMDQALLNERDTKRSKMRPSFADEGPAILPRIRPSKHESDMDSTRSTPPPRGLGRGLASNRRGAPLKYQIFEASSPAHTVNEGVVARKPRPPTAHQLAVERNRSQRVEYILDRGLRRQHHKSRKLRRQDGAVFRAYQRLQVQEDPFEDSDDETSTPRNLTYGDKTPGPFREKGVGGLCLLTKEKDDFGEEVSAYAGALRRATRRLARWGPRSSELGVIAPVKRPRPKKPGEDDGDLDLDDEMDKQNGDANGDVTLGDVTVGDMTAGDITMGDVTMDDAEIEDQTVLHDDEDVDDADRTEVMGDSDVD
ncbi:Dictyostelium kinase [Fusarium tjaetaba]|uniref:Dictyostelium kinase n=1 Tax=Fusarium tjaetaba TaxID=1567544 RepID=A0A8H5RDR3_9HYPO|nr:Dictyostelium kinase [Fusarium tjaetaba]KAF5630682.1 Dictyostelium kinase [Fusarium tjaetaba]